MKKNPITVSAPIEAPIHTVWNYYTQPEHIVNWNYATAEWHCPHATCDLKPGGKFSFRMAARDGSFGFDFNGTYVDIRPEEFISYILEDDRKVQVTFKNSTDGILVEQTFEPEDSNSEEMQRSGWQAILDNFKNYVESIK